MSWRFVGRSDEIDRIRTALRNEEPGPIVIAGESGMGRTAVLSRALEYADHKRDSVLRVEPAGDEPFAALRPHLPGEISASSAALGEAVPAAARALAEWAGGRRLVVALDDAHLADHASLLALRALSRQGTAVLLATRCVSAVDQRLDPTDTLRYEQGMQTLSLRPLSKDEVAVLLAGVVGGHVYPPTTEALHAATGGNPRLLYTLMVENRLVESLVTHDGQWRLGEVPPAVSVDGRMHPGQLADVVDRAWRELAVDRTDELCRLAMWHGAGEEVAAAWANVLLLRGRAEEGIHFLDSLPAGRVEESVELALGKAMTLAFGVGRIEAAGNSLLRATIRNAELRDRLLAYRAWILAVTGRAAKAAEALEGVEKTDRETAVFVHATRAVISLAASYANEAVFHLRRALVAAETCPGIPPWLPPYLTACLIDAMMLAGRIGEATTIANGFHGGEPGSGWEIAVMLSALVTGRRPRHAAEAKRAREENRTIRQQPLAEPQGSH